MPFLIAEALFRLADAVADHATVADDDQRALKPGGSALTTLVTRLMDTTVS